jgi:hypothetical protein
MNKYLCGSVSVVAVLASTALASAQNDRGQLPDSYYSYASNPNNARSTGPWSASRDRIIEHRQITMPPSHGRRNPHSSIKTHAIDVPATFLKYGARQQYGLTNGCIT